MTQRRAVVGGDRHVSQCKQEQAMPTSTETFYSSSNGDRWQLVRDEEAGQMLVRHEPNFASGGRASDVAVPEFLSRSGTSPQAIALRELLEKRGEADAEDE
jgi:hypothetical protein